MKKPTTVVALLVVGLVAYIAVGPLITLHQIKTGIEDQDSETLAANVDFPVLRANLKEQFNANMAQQAANQLSGNPFEALGVALGSKIIEGMVDAFVTPTGLARLAGGRMPGQAITTNRSTAADGTSGKPFQNAQYGFDTPSRFSVWTAKATGGSVRFVLTREGLSWKLTNIVIPFESESVSTLSSKQVIPKIVQSSLKLEAIDTRVTEENSVWARYAWKLSISNSNSSPAEFNAHIDWLDADGFVIDSDDAYHLSLDGHETNTFTGDKLISNPAASKVTKIEAKIGE